MRQDIPQFILDIKKYQFVPERTKEGILSHIVPYTQEMKQYAFQKCVSQFHQFPHSEQNFQKYQRIIHNVWHKYDSFEYQLKCLSSLLSNFSTSKDIKNQKSIQLLYAIRPTQQSQSIEPTQQVQQEQPGQPTGQHQQQKKLKLLEVILYKDKSLQYVEKLSNKLKVVYSKGRKDLKQSQIHAGIDNCMERCQKFNEQYQSGTFKQKSLLRRAKFQQLYMLKKRFDIINPIVAQYYSSHPLKQQLFERKNVLLSFYTENLLLRPNKKRVQFNKSLLYCPILISNEESELKVAPQYQQNLCLYLKDWENKVLSIEIFVLNKLKMVSYLRKQYKRDNIIQEVSLIRDKIYQMMMLQFLKSVTETKRNEIFFQTSIAEIQIKVSLRNINSIMQEKEKPEYINEFISIFLSLMNYSKLQQMQNNQIISKIKLSMEQLLISRHSTSSTIMVDVKPEFTKYFKKTTNSQNIPITAEEALRTYIIKDEKEVKQ